MRLCEEHGLGIDRVIRAAEDHLLPPPDFQAPGSHTVAVLYAPRPFAEMTKEERVRACFQHAGLMVMSGKQMTNATLRKRFGTDMAKASKVIADALEEGLIKRFHIGSRDKRYVKYVPWWGPQIAVSPTAVEASEVAEDWVEYEIGDATEYDL
jgi:predicted HTH transcriptional regulator